MRIPNPPVSSSQKITHATGLPVVDDPETAQVLVWRCALSMRSLYMGSHHYTQAETYSVVTPVTQILITKSALAKNLFSKVAGPRIPDKPCIRHAQAPCHVMTSRNSTAISPLHEVPGSTRLSTQPQTQNLHLAHRSSALGRRPHRTLSLGELFMRAGTAM